MWKSCIKGAYWKIMGYSWNRRESCRAFSLERMEHLAALDIQRAGTKLQDTSLSGSTGFVLCPSVTWFRWEKQRLIGLVCITQQRWVWHVDWQPQPDWQILSEADLPSAWHDNLCSALPILSWLGLHPLCWGSITSFWDLASGLKIPTATFNCLASVGMMLSSLLRYLLWPPRSLTWLALTFNSYWKLESGCQTVTGRAQVKPGWSLPRPYSPYSSLLHAS